MKGELFTTLTANEEANLSGGRRKLSKTPIQFIFNGAGSNNGSASVNIGSGSVVGLGAPAINPGDSGNQNSSTNGGSGNTGGVGISIVFNLFFGPVTIKY